MSEVCETSHGAKSAQHVAAHSSCVKKKQDCVQERHENHTPLERENGKCDAGAHTLHCSSLLAHGLVIYMRKKSILCFDTCTGFA